MEHRVKGRGQRTEVGGRRSEVRDQKLMLRVELPVGAAFPDLSLSKVSRDLAH